MGVERDMNLVPSHVCSRPHQPSGVHAHCQETDRRPEHSSLCCCACVLPRPGAFKSVFCLVGLTHIPGYLDLSVTRRDEHIYLPSQITTEGGEHDT
jgi:hypothetical protein